MSYRSEDNRIPNKQNYTDLSLSQYPNRVDTRTNNTNMRGFINVGEGHVPDYVMASYINALNDGVMAIQRALGETPMVPFGTQSGQLQSVIESGTVSGRIRRIEDGLFDVRYGGQGWQNVENRPTLSRHNHDGLNGHPAKINLVSEITGRLNKGNINLAASNGLTGADIFVSNQNQIKINEAINDSLSKSAGGTVTGDTHFRGQFSSRTRLDMVAPDFSRPADVALTSDNTATAGRTLRLTTAGSTQDIARLTTNEKGHLLYGKYIIGVRVKSSTQANSPILRFLLGNQSQTVTGSEIGSGWGYIYWSFTHDHTNRTADLRIQKLSSAASATLNIDNIFIEPIHPAVLDR